MGMIIAELLGLDNCGEDQLRTRPGEGFIKLHKLCTEEVSNSAFPIIVGAAIGNCLIVQF